MNDDTFWVLGVIGFICTIVFGLAFGLTYWECNGYQNATGKETKLSGGNCYINDDGEWYMWGEYKYRLATKGEFKGKQ